jgi:molybdate transport system regulatory protein
VPDQLVGESLVSSIWLFFRFEFHRAAGGAEAIGPHRANILEAIDRFGSISAAAQAVDLTFRQTWRVVQLLNAQFNKPLIGIRRSGRSSGAFLTPLGKEVLARFREMERVANEALEPHFRAFEKITGMDPKKKRPIPRFAQIVDPSAIAPLKKKPARRPKAEQKKIKKKLGKRAK